MNYRKLFLLIVAFILLLAGGALAGCALLPTAPPRIPCAEDDYKCRVEQLEAEQAAQREADKWRRHQEFVRRHEEMHRAGCAAVGMSC